MVAVLRSDPPMLSRPRARLVELRPAGSEAGEAVDDHRLHPGLLVLAAIVVLVAAAASLPGFLSWTAGPLAAPEIPAAPVAASELVEVVGVATYVVQPGDTLWSIARAHRPNGDLSAIVADLAAANGGSVIRVGQLVSVPLG